MRKRAIMLLCAVAIILNLTACDNENTSDNPDMVSIWNDLTENGGSWSSDVKITLSDVWLSCSVEGGLSGSGEIVAVEGVG